MIKPYCEILINEDVEFNLEELSIEDIASMGYVIFMSEENDAYSILYYLSDYNQMMINALTYTNWVMKNTDSIIKSIKKLDSQEFNNLIFELREMELNQNFSSYT